jgi:hypothetical protein
MACNVDQTWILKKKKEESPFLLQVHEDDLSKKDENVPSNTKSMFGFLVRICSHHKNQLCRPPQSDFVPASIILASICACQNTGKV